MPIVLALFVFWFLQVGPVPVPFLPAYLEQALSAAGGLTARIGRAFVAWEHTGPEIRLTDIRATDAGEAVSVAAASASIEFDLSALAAG